MEPAGVAGLRIVFAAVIVVAWQWWGSRSPDAVPAGALDPTDPAATGLMARVGRDRDEWADIVAFGLALAAMNVSIYLAISQLPLGTAVAIEFLGPVSVAAYAARTARSWVALVLVAGGATLMANVVWAGGATGVAFALVAALGWAAYIGLGWRIANHESPADALAASFAVAALIVLPLALIYGGPAGRSARLLGLCVLVGLVSSVIPYRIDQVVLAAMSAGTFALLQALLPVVALIIGVIVLGERPGLAELMGFAAVVAGIALRDPVSGFGETGVGGPEGAPEERPPPPAG